MTSADRQVESAAADQSPEGENGPNVAPAPTVGYRGAMQGRLRHGSGRYQYKNAAFSYDGEWEQNVKNGRGKFTVAGYSTYEGDFLDGEMTGQGEMSWTSGATYSGEFLNGEPHGQGVHVSADGETYEGEFHFGVRQGSGVLHGPEVVKEGHWHSHRMHGHGIMTHNDGTRYEGDWSKGEFHGQGEMRWANGDMYTGGWSHGSRQGKGTFFHASTGMSFDCQWLDDRPEVVADKLCPVTSAGEVCQRLLEAEQAQSEKGAEDQGDGEEGNADGEDAEVEKPATPEEVLREAELEARRQFLVSVTAGQKIPELHVLCVQASGAVVCSHESRRIVRVCLSKDEDEGQPAKKEKGAPPPPPPEEEEVADPGANPPSLVSLIFDSATTPDQGEKEEAEAEASEEAEASQAGAHFPPRFHLSANMHHGVCTIKGIRIPETAVSGRHTLRLWSVSNSPFADVSPLLLRLQVEAAAQAGAKKKK